MKNEKLTTQTIREKLTVRKRYYMTKRCQEKKTKMHLATTNSHRPHSCISSAYSIINDISVGIVNWLRIQRPGNFKLISEWGK
jgi:hypothetical protein